MPYQGPIPTMPAIVVPSTMRMPTNMGFRIRHSLTQTGRIARIGGWWRWMWTETTISGLRMRWPSRRTRPGTQQPFSIQRICASTAILTRMVQSKRTMRYLRRICGRMWTASPSRPHHRHRRHHCRHCRHRTLHPIAIRGVPPAVHPYPQGVIHSATLIRCTGIWDAVSPRRRHRAHRRHSHRPRPRRPYPHRPRHSRLSQRHHHPHPHRQISLERTVGIMPTEASY